MEVKIMPDLEIDGIGTIEVDDNFSQLPPEQQNAFVQNVISQISRPQPKEDKGMMTRGVEALGGFAKGIPQGLGKTLVGGIQTATDIGEAGARAIEKSIYGDVLEQDTFGKRLAKQVGRQEEREAQLPTSERAGIATGEIAPYLTTGAGTGAKILAKTGSKILAGMGAGAVGGAVSTGLAPREEAGLSERAEETLRGSGVGTLTGGALSTLSKAPSGIKRLFTAKKPEDVLAKGLPAGQTAEILEKLKAGGEDVLLPDVAGDTMQGLTRALGKTKGGKDLINEALEKRSESALTRVRNELTKVSPVDSYFGSLDDLAKARSEIASPIYKKAFEKGTALDINKNKALFEKIAPDIKDARRIFRMGDEIKDNSIVMLDAAKKSLDDKIGKAFRQGEKQEARALMEIKNDLVSKLDELNPDYKKARQVFSDFASIENAQQQGLQFNKLRPEQLNKYVKGLTPSEQEAFRIGVRESLDKITAKSTTSPAKKIFGNTEIQNQLKAIFPDSKSYGEFRKRMLEEIQFADTKFKVLGGSRTDINLASEEEFLNKVAEVGTAGMTGGKSTLIGATIRSIKNKFNGISEKNAKQLASIVVNKGKSIDTLEKILAKESNPTQKEIIRDMIKILVPSTTTTKAIEEEYGS
jgi:hypothetical protein